MAEVAIKSGVPPCSCGEVLELVEQAGLENRCTLTGTVGSNPTLSANNPCKVFILVPIDF